MNFAERNAAWTGHLRTFQQLQSRASKPGFWSIEVVGPEIRTQWGRLGGKLQTAREVVQGVNLGKSNEKPPHVYALERAREMARKRHEYEGYREYTMSDFKPVFLDPIIEGQIDFDDLEPSLSFYKPQNVLETDCPALWKATQEGKTWYTRKRNGMMKVLCCNTRSELNIYSRRMLRQHDDEIGSDFTWDDRFPHLIHAIERHLPPRTILLGELVVEVDGKESFKTAQSYIKSLTPKAVQDMQDSGLFPFFYCWDIAFWAGEDWVSHKPMRERFLRIQELAGYIVGREMNTNAFRPLEVMKFDSPERSIEYAKEHDIEGWVVVDPDQPGYGDKAYNFKGKPDRPRKWCAKHKPTWEDDFVAIWDPDKGYGERSTKARRGGGIKSVGLYQYNKQGELVFIANCNSGLTDEFLAANANPKLYPQVWQVEYKGRRYISDGDDSNSLDFPTFLAVRSDKKPGECMNERL